jgi:anti-repressor protein
MMNELTNFNFSGNLVGVIMVNNEPWWRASDVCNVLGYANGRDAVKRHCKEGGVVKYDTPTDSGIQLMTYINESNLYRLISHSNLPSAEKFESWIYEEVLPQIRKTGSYGVQLPTDPVEQVLLLASKLTETAKLVLEERNKNQALTHHIQEMQPKVDLAEKCLSADNELSFTQVAKSFGLSGKSLCKILRTEKILYYHHKANIPYQKYLDKGLFKVITITIGVDGDLKNRTQTLVTPNGYQFICEILKKAGINKVCEVESCAN